MSGAAPRLLLASKSEARRKMLEAAGVPFEVVEAELDEQEAKAGLLATGFEPRDLAEMLADMKAHSISAPTGTLVLGADQVLEQENGATLSKPRSRAEAAAQLRGLSGRTHYLHSGAVIVEKGERVWGRTETAALSVRELSDGFIARYLDAEYEQIRWSVGGYRIEGPGVQLFEEVQGSHFAILGLPLLSLLDFLRTRGVLQS
jgi:septum formation protein